MRKNLAQSINLASFCNSFLQILLSAPKLGHFDLPFRASAAAIFVDELDAGSFESATNYHRPISASPGGIAFVYLAALSDL